MKLVYIGLMKWKPGSEEPVLLGSAAELSDYSFFQRGSIKEFMCFTGKTVARKTQAGARQTVKAQAYMCHVVVRNSHLAAVVFCDEAYPSRAAMSVAMQLINDYEAAGSTAWKTADADISDAAPLCEQALVKYKARRALSRLSSERPCRRMCSMPVRRQHTQRWSACACPSLRTLAGPRRRGQADASAARAG